MKRTILTTTLAALVAATTFGADAPVQRDEKFNRAVRDSLPVCTEQKIELSELPRKLPSGFTATVVRVESKDRGCQGQWVGVTTTTGGFFLGTPWFLDAAVGDTLEQKLRDFTWKAMQQTFTPTIDKQRNQYGLYRVTLEQTTERGKIPIEGFVDQDGTVFFFGAFRPLASDIRAERAKVFEPFVAVSPSRGAAKPAVTVLEFSDFECPSCRHAANFLEPILAKHGASVRYVRLDLPLITSHPWAFSAAVAGRAIHRQKPDAFWEYKKQVYANQDTLSAFTFDDFARGFAKDHDLDLAKFDADIASKELQEQILRGVGTAFSNDIRATPSYLVNGAVVEPGMKGEDLAAYIDKLLAK